MKLLSILLLGSACVAREFTGELNLLLENAIVGDGGGNADIELYPSCPHRGVYLFVNWPVGLKERNPEEIFPRHLYDKHANYLVVRSGWKGNSGIVLTMRHGAGMATGAGLGRTGFPSDPEV